MCAKALTLAHQMTDLVRLASFDIGKKNFAFYIEEFDRKKLMKLVPPPETQRYHADGSPTPKMAKFLAKVSRLGKTVLHRNLDLTAGCDKKLALDPTTFHNMNDALNRYIVEWDRCSAFVVEKQMQFSGRGKNNPMAQKLGQHCYSYFTFRYGRERPVVEFSAQHKTRILGAQKTAVGVYKNGKTKWKGLTKPQRKKWCVGKATEILRARGEESILEGLTTASKRDDLADVVCQLQAFKILAYIYRTL